MADSVSRRWSAEEFRRQVTTDDAAWRAGLDVAGPGEDETVLIIAHGSQIVKQQAWPTPDPRGDVVAMLAPYRDHGITVAVDSCGIGYYVARHLEDEGLDVSDVNVGEGSSDRERYVNLKAELYWTLRQRFEEGDIGGLEDDRTIGQLTGIRYRHNSRGQIVIESKEEARKRGVKSPDRAEALMLCFTRAGDGPAAMTFGR